MENISLISNDENYNKHNYNVAKYIKRIRDKLIKYLPDDVKSLTYDIKLFLDNHLEDAVVETIKEAVPLNVLSDLDTDLVDAMMDAARQTFVRNAFLLHPLLAESHDLSYFDEDNIIVQLNPKVAAENFVLNVRTGASSRRREEAKAMELFKTAAELRNMEQKGQPVDLSKAKSLSFHARWNLPEDVKKIPKREISRMGGKTIYTDQMEEYVEKQRIVKKLMQELNVVMNNDPHTYSYMNIEKLADHFVVNLIKTAKKKVMEYQLKQESESIASGMFMFYGDTDPEPSVIEFVEVFGSFKAWPKISEFTIETGADRISDYLATWHYQEEWLYDLDMILAQSDACSDFYKYEVKWSIPTREYPVPQATASVFFTIEVSRVLPRDCYVNVTYQFEGAEYIHEPFKHPFQERWLFNIIESKLKFFQTITF